MFNQSDKYVSALGIVLSQELIVLLINYKGGQIMITKNIKGKKGLSYCRVSSQEQKDGTSLNEQEIICVNFAKKYNINIKKIYKEEASAMKPEKRPMFNEMVKKLQNEEADVVIFAYIDRMARNSVDGYKILQLVEEKELTAVFVQENLVLQAPIRAHEMLMLDTILGVSNYRVRQDKEKCMAGIKARALSGFRPCRPPYGYKNMGLKDKKQAFVSKKRADFVKKAFELYSTGDYSVTEVADKLYEQGFRYELQPSKVIPKQSLISMLKNRFYVGMYYVKQADEYVKGNHEAIISEETFDKVQKLLELAPKTPRKHNLLYSKLLTCSNCGHCMVGDVKEKPNGKKYVYYRCTNPQCEEHLSLSETTIDNDLAAYLKEIHLGLIPDEIVEEVQKEELQKLIQEVSTLKRNISRKHHSELRFQEKIAKNDIIDEKYIQSGFAEIQEKYGDLDSKIYLAQKQIDMIKSKTDEAFKKRLYDVYNGFDIQTKRKTLELVTSTFKCTPKRLKMTFKSAFRKIRKR